MSIRPNLKKLRRKLKCNQTEFGEKVGGYSKTHISDLENCKADPSFGFIEDVERLCLKEGIIIEDMWEVFRKEE